VNDSAASDSAFSCSCELTSDLVGPTAIECGDADLAERERVPWTPPQLDSKLEDLQSPEALRLLRRLLQKGASSRTGGVKVCDYFQAVVAIPIKAL
jgi:hypothetical protein